MFAVGSWSNTNLDDLFVDSIDNLVKDINVNTIGGYTTIKETVQGFHRLPPTVPKAFIATGNVLPWNPMPPYYYSLGASKAALAHIVETGGIFYRTDNFRSVISIPLSQTSIIC